jgi:hypothetical protein
MTLSIYNRNGEIKRSEPGFAPQAVVSRGYCTGNVSLSAFTWTKISLNTRLYDPYGFIDTTNGRFQPKVPGYYRISGHAQLVNNTVATRFIGGLWKNGIEASGVRDEAWFPASSTEAGATPIATFYLNGTTDYVELMAYVSAVNSVTGAQWGSDFSAELVGASVGVAPEPPRTVASLGFSNGWSANGSFTPYFQKSPNGIVTLWGAIASGTYSGTNAAFTLPQGYRPNITTLWHATHAYAGGDVFARVGVYSDGRVCVANVSNGAAATEVWLNPINFYASQ